MPLKEFSHHAESHRERLESCLFATAAKRRITIEQQSTFQLRKDESEPFRETDTRHRPHHTALRGCTMRRRSLGGIVLQGIPLGKLQLRHWRGWADRDIRGGMQPLMVLLQ